MDKGEQEGVSTVLVTGGSGFIGSYCVTHVRPRCLSGCRSRYHPHSAPAHGAAAKRVPTWQLPN